MSDSTGQGGSQGGAGGGGPGGTPPRPPSSGGGGGGAGWIVFILIFGVGNLILYKTTGIFLIPIPRK